MGRLHQRTHKHTSVSRDGMGLFRICESRWLFGRAYVTFQPDGSDRLYMVPFERCLDGQSVLQKMIRAADSTEALRILRTSKAYG